MIINDNKIRSQPSLKKESINIPNDITLPSITNQMTTKNNPISQGSQVLSKNSKTILSKFFL